MNEKTYKVASIRRPSIKMKVTPGHFATISAHVTHYLDMSSLKTNAALAREVARELSFRYRSNTLVDIIICMEHTEIIGAYLARDLLQEGTMVMNTGGDIHVVTPANTVTGQLLIPPSESKYIKDKNIILLVDSVSTGKTISRVMECISYYGGTLVGISALFSAMSSVQDQEINSIFTADDIDGYSSVKPSACEMCANGEKLDAIVNSFGASTL